MERLKRNWKLIPHKPRRVLTLIIGVLLIILSGLIGWIPGPGGMIPFLLGIAVLASEFEWAERLRDWILGMLRKIARYIRSHPVFSAIVMTLGAGIAGILAYALYTHII